MIQLFFFVYINQVRLSHVFHMHTVIQSQVEYQENGRSSLCLIRLNFEALSVAVYFEVEAITIELLQTRFI